MTRELICIECPLGCKLSADIENNKVTATRGNKCPKGEAYLVSEVESPRRFFTATVLAENLEIKMVPVRTTVPILKSKIIEAAVEVKKVRVSKPVSVGEVIVKDFLGLGVDLVATRTVYKNADL
jgi:CxxC motif-containing protein